MIKTPLRVLIAFGQSPGKTRPNQARTVLIIYARCKDQDCFRTGAQTTCRLRAKRDAFEKTPGFCEGVKWAHNRRIRTLESNKELGGNETPRENGKLARGDGDRPSALSQLKIGIGQISRRALAPGFCRSNRGLAPCG
jgi:hypothetical protein